METITRTVRIKKSDAKRIDEFLNKNPIFDFSTLVRVALEQFMKRPSIDLKPLREKHRQGGEHVQSN